MKRLVMVSSLALLFSGIIPLDQAHAALDNNLCDKGELCVWEAANMTGCFSDIGVDQLWNDLSRDHYDTCPSTTMNDTISSFFNNSGMGIGFFTDTEFKGKLYCAYPNSSSPRIHSDWNDKISSLISSSKGVQPNDKCEVRKKNQG